jgi:hypothetical protein
VTTSAPAITTTSRAARAGTQRGCKVRVYHAAGT